VPDPPPPTPGQVEIAIKAVGLNHLDLWGFRGMAFARRSLPLTVGVEAAGEILRVGSAESQFRPGDPVVMFGALTCNVCPAGRGGRDNLGESPAGVRGFPLDGFAGDRVVMDEPLVTPVPAGPPPVDAACAPVAYSTVEHMLFDNAKFEPGETILV